MRNHASIDETSAGHRSMAMASPTSSEGKELDYYPRTPTERQYVNPIYGSNNTDKELSERPMTKAERKMALRSKEMRGKSLLSLKTHSKERAKQKDKKGPLTQEAVEKQVSELSQAISYAVESASKPDKSLWRQLMGAVIPLYTINLQNLHYKAQELGQQMQKTLTVHQADLDDRFVQQLKMYDKIVSQLLSDLELLLNKLERRRQSRELIAYLVFIMLFTAVVVMQLSPNTGAVIEGALRQMLDSRHFSVTDVRTRWDFYRYMEVSLNNILCTYDDYVAGRCATSSTTQEGFCFDTNLILSLTIIQGRSIAAKCDYGGEAEVDAFSSIYPDCFTSEEDKSPWLGNDPDLFSDYFPGVARDPTQSFEPTIGHIAQLDTSSFAAASQGLQILQSGAWLNNATSSVTVKLSVFNGIMVVVGEAWMAWAVNDAGVWDSADGGLRTSSVPPYSYQTQAHMIRWGFECLLALSVAFFIYSMILPLIFSFQKYKRKGILGIEDVTRNNYIMSWLNSVVNGWLLLDVYMAGAFLICGIYWLLYTMQNKDVQYDPQIIRENSDEWVKLQDVTTFFESYSLWSTTTLLAGYVGIFRFFKFNRRLSILTNTIVHALPEISNFLVMFFIAYCSFTLYAYMNFGTRGLEDFASPGVSMDSMFKMMLGEYNVRDLYPAGQHAIVRIFFYLFTVLVAFVMVNIFLAIVIESYSYAWKEEESQEASMKQGSKQFWESAYKGAMRLLRRLFPAHFHKSNPSRLDQRIEMAQRNFTEAQRRADRANLQLAAADYTLMKERRRAELVQKADSPKLAPSATLRRESFTRVLADSDHIDPSPSTSNRLRRASSTTGHIMQSLIAYSEVLTLPEREAFTSEYSKPAISPQSHGSSFAEEEEEEEAGVFVLSPPTSAPPSEPIGGEGDGESKPSQRLPMRLIGDDSSSTHSSMWKRTVQRINQSIVEGERRTVIGDDSAKLGHFADVVDSYLSHTQQQCGQAYKPSRFGSRGERGGSSEDRHLSMSSIRIQEDMAMMMRELKDLKQMVSQQQVQRYEMLLEEQLHQSKEVEKLEELSGVMGRQMQQMQEVAQQLAALVRPPPPPDRHPHQQ